MNTVIVSTGLNAYDLSPVRFNSVTEWPLWAKALKLMATPEDKGIGDTIARSIGPVGGDAFKAWYLKMFGKPCGCTWRQSELNRKYPLP